MMGPLRPVWGALGSLGIALAFNAAAVALFIARGTWLNLATPLLLVPVAVGATALYRFMGVERIKGVDARTLERYVRPEVAQEILERRHDIALGGTRRRITMLFCDIRGFTSLSERLKPEEVREVSAASWIMRICRATASRHPLHGALWPSYDGGVTYRPGRPLLIALVSVQGACVHARVPVASPSRPRGSSPPASATFFMDR